jgi:hypothetical protein
MIRTITSLVALCFLGTACGSEDGPRLINLFANQGFVAENGEVISDGSGFKVDLIAYEHTGWLDLKAGRDGPGYEALNDLNRVKYQTLDEVPCTEPTDADKNKMFQLPESGHALTVRLNKSDGFMKVLVLGEASGGAIQLEYVRCP